MFLRVQGLRSGLRLGRVYQCSHGWLSKLWSLFGSLLFYGTYYFGYPKRGHNFDNDPHEPIDASTPNLLNLHVTQASHLFMNPEGPYTLCIMELGTKRPSPLWFWGPNSIMVVYVDPLGYESDSKRHNTMSLKSLFRKKLRIPGLKVSG